MTVRLYLDEDSMDQDLVQALQARGVDLLTPREADMLGCGDEEQLDYATTQGRVLYSFNVGHFYQLHTTYLAAGKAHAGIILSPQQRYSVGEQMRRVLKLVAVKSAEDMQNQVEFLGAWG